MFFFGTIGLIVIAAGIPLLAMYACGQFKDQKPANGLLKMAVIVGVGLGLITAVFSAAGLYIRSGGLTPLEWIALAWIAGSALAGQVALLELIGRRNGSG